MEGNYAHTIDAKGRLFVPARFREEIGDTFYVTVSMDKCLTAYSKEYWDRFKEKVNAMPKEGQNALRVVFANAQKCDLDGQGRVLLAQNLREWAGLDKNVTVVGNNNCMEIWDSEEWSVEYARQTTPEMIAKAYKEFNI